MEDCEKEIYASLVSNESDIPESAARATRVYDGSSWYITVRLSDIPCAEITEVEDEERGTAKRGIFIPFREGGLTVTPKKNVLAVFKAELAQIPNGGYTHLLTQVTDYDIENENKKLGFFKGFVGKMRPAKSRKYSPKKTKYNV